VIGTGAIENNDAAFLMLIEKIFPLAMQGVTAAAIYSAIMSTAAGLLLAAAAALANDIIPKLKKTLTEKQKTRIGSGAVFLVSLVVLLLSFNPPEFLTILYSQAMGLLISCLAIPLMGGLWWKRATPLGAILALFGGGVTFVIVFFVVHVPSMSEMFFTLPVSLVLLIIGSYASKPPSQEIIDRVALWHKNDDAETETAK
jgi:Na+/proline symporter